MYIKKTPEQQQKMVSIGTTGEKIVQRTIKNLYGGDYELFLNTYDMRGDGQIKNSERWNDCVCEVKTQVPFIKINAVSFQPKQLEKILKQDVVFFVVFNPKDKPSYTYGNSVYAIEAPHKYRDDFFQQSLASGEVKYYFPLTHKAMEKIADLTTEEIELLQRDTVSGGYFGKSPTTYYKRK